MRRSPVVKSAQEVAAEWVDLTDGLPEKQLPDALAYAEAERKERQRIETIRQAEYNDDLKTLRDLR